MYSSSSFLDNINNSNKIIDIDIFNLLEQHMLTVKNLTRLTKYSLKNNSPNLQIKNNIKRNIEIKRDKYYYINKEDTLFWIFYIMKHGFSNYEMNIDGKYFTVEKQEKFRYVDLLRQQYNKDLLKMHKLKPLSEIETDLSCSKKISIKTFFALCIIEKINIMLVDKKKLYKIKMNDTDNIFIVHKNNDNNTFYIELNTDEKVVKTYETNFFQMETLEFKLKSMGSYKLEELNDMCTKLGIVLDLNGKKKLLKKDIYELLVQHF